MENLVQYGLEGSHDVSLGREGHKTSICVVPSDVCGGTRAGSILSLLGVPTIQKRRLEKVAEEKSRFSPTTLYTTFHPWSRLGKEVHRNLFGDVVQGR